MRRVLSLHMPWWSTDLTRRRMWRGRAGSGERRCILLTGAVGGRELVVRCCQRSAARGVRPGMPLSEARPLTPRDGALIAAHRPERDAAALVALAEWALRFSPVVAPDPPDGLFIDATGMERLHANEEDMARLVCRSVGRLGIAARAGIAATPGCAWAVARFGEKVVVPGGREREAMAPLPVECLRLDDAALLGLAEVGVERMGDLLRLPRSALPSRFGAAVVLRLDQALGWAMEPLERIRPEPPVRVELVFEGPTDRWETVAEAVWAAVGRLAVELEHRGRGARDLVLELRRAHVCSEWVRVALCRPSRQARHLWSLLRPRLEGANLGDGVEGVVLTAPRTGRLRHEQAASEVLGGSGEKEQRGLGEMIDTLVNRLGADGVLRAEPVESHLPERAFRYRSVMEHESRDEARVTFAPRPSTLLQRPEEAGAVSLTPDGPVLMLRWRGTDWRVLSSQGPERLAGEWWMQAGERAVRDYYAVQVEGGRTLWVCRELDQGRWFVHGEWA